MQPGRAGNVTLTVGESYSGASVGIDLHIRRGEEAGPAVFVTAALHGDEINGCGAVRQLIQDDRLKISRGVVVLVPVLNLLAFERHSRYLPDRRDLNRSFPGSADGSLAARMAHTIFHELVARCDYGIDLHTASVRRTNYPTVRADLQIREAKRIASAFGSEIIINNKGPKNSFRREACRVGCPTIIMEGGEVWKLEP
ncbi:MAG: succinylglutamate desuccinylase/aspartoacylase family protein, partial [Desulfobacterales bacterium]